MEHEEEFWEVGLRIRKLRGAMQQTEFAERLGVDRKSVAGWEAGKRLPDGKSLLALITVFGADVNYLLTGAEGASAGLPDAAAGVLLDSYRRCTPQARQNLIQTAALFSAGLGPAAASPATSHQQNIGSGAGMVNHGAGAVQVGYSAGKVKVKREQ